MRSKENICTCALDGAAEGAVYSFAVGHICIVCQGGAVTALNFAAPSVDKGCPTALTEWAAEELYAYFEGRRRVFTFPILMQGTPFQRKVWQALMTIPYGQTCSYGALAAQIGMPKAARAVGHANHCNPLPIVVPCHRVVGARGDLVGYAGGLDIKQALLDLERRYGAEQAIF